MDGLAEQEFVQACLSHALYPERPLPIDRGGLDWARVLELLARHGLTRIFYRLGREESDGWPQPFQRALRIDYEAARLWGELCGEEVGAALEALAGAGVPGLVLKGWALIPALYGGDPGLRMCGDLDLLVQRRDAARAEEVMAGLGYGGRLEPWPGFDRRYRRVRVFRRPRQPWPFQDAFAVSLHVSLLDTPFYFEKIEAEALFERSLPLHVAGAEGRRLSIEDDLVYACGHLALHHGYDDALVRSYEMAAVIVSAGNGLDWAAVGARAAEWRLVLPVQRVVGRLRTLWPEIVPAAAWERIAGLRPRRSERLVHRWVVEERENHAVRAILAWLTMPGRGTRWRYLVEHTFPGADYLRQRYGAAPGGMWPLLYVRRMGLAARYAAAAAGRRAHIRPSDRSEES
jgi:hypothetical protein